jgi:hypothetical protein
LTCKLLLAPAVLRIYEEKRRGAISQGLSEHKAALQMPEPDLGPGASVYPEG